MDKERPELTEMFEQIEGKCYTKRYSIINKNLRERIKVQLIKVTLNKKLKVHNVWARNENGEKQNG